MDKKAIKAVARLTHINLTQAITVVRHNPLLGDEIFIEEELINLEEAIQAHRMASDTLEKYPEMKLQMISEKRLILKHCIGLVLRMLQGRRLPREYSAQDTQVAIRKLVRLVIKDVSQNEVAMDETTLEAVRPFMGWRMRVAVIEQVILRVWSGVVASLPRNLAFLRS